jgi:glycosyltransferase involved in cell wall biosynthesis
MVYVSVSYTQSLEFDLPETWLNRIEGYIGILECLAKENIVYHINQINFEGEYFHKGVRHYFLKFGEKRKLFPWQLNRFVKNITPDIIIVQGLHNPIQLILLHLILNKKTKIIAHHHAEKPLPGIKKYAQKLADRYIDAYLFASMDMGLEWVKKGNISSARKIHEVMEVSSNFHPVEGALAEQKTGISGNPAFLWVGRLNANKDPLNVVRAFLKYLKTQPDARLYMIYQTDELLADIKALLETNPQGNAIKLIGKVPHDDLLYWFNSADFLISGSHYEGSGTAVCEAMSCGCIPIVTDIFSFRMITDNGKCGILYEAGNEAALLDVLNQIGELDLEEKRELCLSFFREKLSFPAIAKQIQEIAKSL